MLSKEIIQVMSELLHDTRYRTNPSAAVSYFPNRILRLFAYVGTETLVFTIDYDQPNIATCHRRQNCHVW